jgi:hypothetical protein
LKHLRISITTLNVRFKSHHLIEENANQCGHPQAKGINVKQDTGLFFKVNKFIILCKNFLLA